MDCPYLCSALIFFILIVILECSMYIFFCVKNQEDFRSCADVEDVLIDFGIILRMQFLPALVLGG